MSLSLYARDVKTTFDSKAFKKPVCFVENMGQVTDEKNHVRTDIKYKLSTPGLNLFLGSNTLLYEFKKNEITPGKEVKISAYQMEVTLLGANPNSTVVSEEKQEYHENYYPSSGNNVGFTANSYNKIVYQNVYPNIDWVLYVKDDKVEYDFIIKPGGNAHDIKIEYNGATSLQINSDGGVSAVTPMGAVNEKMPVAYENTSRRPVAAKFHLDGNTLSFETSTYTGSLTIDPYLNWSTYFGGGSDDVATCVTSYGASGLLYVAGYTSSASGVSFAVGLPFNTYGGGAYDAFVASYSATGVLAWATYFGGTTYDQGTKISVDGTGNIFLTGYTNSSGIGTPGTYQPAYIAGNGFDAFLIKFSSLGVRQWSTYFGGTGDDYANAITCDPGGNIYIAGQTNSASSIATAGSFQTALSGANDGFFAKFTTTGALIFASYFGGSGQDSIAAIRCDALGNFVFTGQANSINVIATAGAYQTALSGTNDAFVESFTSTGTRSWGTYFGGTGTENGSGIACDGFNNVAIAGNTTSSANIATANTFQTTFGGVQDAFIAVFTTAGALKWSTYYGGSQSDYGGDISVDNLNNFAICGYTLSLTGIASANVVQPSNAGSLDVFVAKLDPLGRRFWGTYFGGTGNETGNSITFDVNNLLTFVGSTTSNSGLHSAGGIASAATVQQPAFGGGTYDAFVTQFTKDTLVLIAQPFLDTLVCAGGTLFVSYTTNSLVTTALNVQLSDASGNFPTLLTSNIIGTNIVSTLTGTITCTIPAGASGTGYRIRIISSTPPFISPDDYYNIHIIPALPLPTVAAKSPICLGANELFSVTANYIITSYNWTGPNSFTSAIYNPTIAGITLADSGMYLITITHNGCPNVNDSILVKVGTVIPATPTATVGTPSCRNYPVTLYANPGAGAGPFTYSWTGPGGFASTMQNPTRIDTAGTAGGVYTLIDTFGGCPSLPTSITVSLTANSTVKIQVALTPPGDTMLCKGDSAVFSSTILNGGPDPVYQWMSGTPDTPVVGAIWTTWSSNHLYNNEKIYCILTSDALCAYPLKDTSNAITMHIADSTPIAYITVSPDSSILPGQNVSFIGYAIYPNTITVFQWYVNDSLVVGANTNIFTIPSVTSQVRVKLQVFTPSKCANPDTAFSNTIKLHFNTGVVNVSSTFRDIDLFPNPSDGVFTIKGVLTDYYSSFVSYDITNTIGQVIFSDRAQVINNELSTTVNLKSLPDGIYLLRINGDGQQKILRFTIQH